MEPGLDGAGPDREEGGGLGLAVALLVAEDEDGAVLGREPAQDVLDVGLELGVAELREVVEFGGGGASCAGDADGLADRYRSRPGEEGFGGAETRRNPSSDR